MTVKPFRRKDRKTGKPIGSFYGKPRSGDAVSLQTRDPTVALERLRLLRQGRWAPVKGRRVSDLEREAEDTADAAAAAGAVDAALAGPAAPPAPAPPLPDPVPPAPAAAAAPPVLTGEVLPPPPRTAEGWAADASAAAGETSSSNGESNGANGAHPPQYVDPDAILQLAAEGWVTGCKMFGRWMARRRHLKPNEIPESEALKVLESMTVGCTKAVISALLPQANDIGPEWGMILGGVALAGMQFVGAVPEDPDAPRSVDGQG